MSTYSVVNSANEIILGTTFTAAKQILSLQASASSGFWVNEIGMGPSGPPSATDCAIEYQLASISTGAATGGTSVTPSVDNPLTPAAASTCMAGGTGGATFVSVRSCVTLNQRATYRWVAIPGQEICVPLTQYLGVSLGAISATYASTVGASMHFVE